MAHNGTTIGWLFGGLFATLLAVIKSAILLIIELVTAMLFYVYLNLSHPDLFGELVRRSSDLFQWLAGLIVPLFQSSANQAYASLIGEMSPKAVLLVLLSLTVGAVIRLFAWLVGRLVEAGTVKHR